MNTITLNNENKTEITFEYDNELPYKERIRPSYEYGTLKNQNNLGGIKINLTKEEYTALNKPEVLVFEKAFFVTDEIWFDMESHYLIIENNDFLSDKIKNSQFIVSFYVENKKINSCGLE